jgi:hypothetical protein
MSLCLKTLGWFYVKFLTPLYGSSMEVVGFLKNLPLQANIIKEARKRNIIFLIAGAIAHKLKSVENSPNAFIKF